MPPSESSPLLVRVEIAPPRQRYPHQVVRRFCTYLMTGTAFVVLILFLLPILLPSLDGAVSTVFQHLLPASLRLPSPAWPESNGISYNNLLDVVLKTPDEERIKTYSQYYASGPHLAGKNLSQAEWTADRWREFGIQNVSIVSYDSYLNYPLDHRLALLKTSKHGHTKVEFEASLEEDSIDEDPTTGLKDRIPTFHGYSASGNVTGQFVYVNYGTVYDFQDLVDRNISLSGNIAIARYGRIFRGLKVKRAQELGMVGVVMYSDPGDDGENTEEKGKKPYPHGPARQPTSVQRGSTQFLSYAPGDPTTPGYPSLPGSPREGTERAIPTIPSLPISYVDALPILKALNGYGPESSSFNKYWQGGGLKYKGVDYNIGPSPKHLTLNLMNEVEYTITPIWDVIGVIPASGLETVVIGNHRDAWIAGGAADPNSGSSALNEVVRSLGAALQAGWKPMRTIVLASWDGEEYGLVGSTEWVEQFLPWLSDTGVAYLNVDVGASGPSFRAASAPLLDNAIKTATELVTSPNTTIPGQTVLDVWTGEGRNIATMGSGSDFTAFQDFAGIPCIDVGFSFDPKSAVYHYHSNYDSYHWMEKYGDKGFHYHAAIAKILGAIAVSVVDSVIIPFSAVDYADALRRYVDKVDVKLIQTSSNATLDDMYAAVEEFKASATKLDAETARLNAEFDKFRDVPYFRWWKRAWTYFRVRQLNSRYMHLERIFLYQEGLDERHWFKHTIFAPGRWTGYAGAVFPGLVESLEDGNMTNFRRWQDIIAAQIKQGAADMKLPKF